MKKRAPTKQEIALPYLQRYSNMPSKTLARLIFSENKIVWPTLNSVCLTVRKIRGKQGVKNKVSIDKAIYAPYFETQERSRRDQPQTLPPTWANPKEVYKLPLGNNKIGFISDLQVPFQDNEAIASAYDWLKNKRVNTIFINGDFIDFYGISHWERDVRKRNFKQEYSCILQALEHLRSNFPTQDIFYFLEANHEKRYERYMSLKAPEVLSLDLPEFDLASILKLRLFDIRPIKNVDRVQIGKLPVLHGHTIFTGLGNSVSPARTVFNKTKQSAIVSHCHQVSEYTAKTLSDEIITCWTTGCLMDLNVEYNPHSNNYSHGFAYIETEPNGDYRVENKRIYKGKVL